jgi:hypothetical protein
MTRWKIKRTNTGEVYKAFRTIKLPLGFTVALIVDGIFDNTQYRYHGSTRLYFPGQSDFQLLPIKFLGSRPGHAMAALDKKIHRFFKESMNLTARENVGPAIDIDGKKAKK